jgi:soluble lytic murein transglycosylase-like protein
VDFFAALTGSVELAAVVLANAEIFSIPPALAFSLCWEESRYNPQAVNRKNQNRSVDRGLFQLNSMSFPDLKDEDFFDPNTNARYGLSHLRWCLDTAGTEVAALAMYNAGVTRVRSSGTPHTTLDYISRILKRQRGIEESFTADYSMRIVAAEIPRSEEKAVFRLSILSPLGGR